MKDFPLDRYRFYFVGNKVIAVSTYCGHNVRGVAKCSAEDKFDVDMGKQLAAARCNLRIAEKRAARAKRKYEASIQQSLAAERYMNQMFKYNSDSKNALEDAQKRVSKLLEVF